MSREVYRLRITKPEKESADLRVHNHRVQYTIPGLGFGCEAMVNCETARLLEVALEAGKELAREEMRKVLGL